jgi:DNA transposition AAA+ family ATPase
MKDTKYINDVRERLQSYLANPNGEMNKVSANAASRGIGMSSATISQFMAGKYTGDNLKVAKAVRAWLRRQAERRSHEDILTETLRTRAVRKLCRAARMCHIEREMGVATGDAGVGKTRGVAYYADENPDVILLEVVPGFTTKTLMSSLHKEAGYNGQGSIYDMFTDVVGRLKGSGRLIIVDEAENLPYKGLELLRRLYDIAKIGILLVGMPELIANLRGNKGEYRQLYSRIGVHAHIPTMKEHPEDVKSLVKSALPGSNGVWKAFGKITRNGRQLEKLLRRSLQVAAKNDSEVTPEVVRNAKQYIII